MGTRRYISDCIRYWSNTVANKPKRPRDVTGNAVHVMKILTGEIEEETPVEKEKNAAAVEMGRKGGKARASKLTSQERTAIARKAAKSRWKKSSEP